ncbi:MAG: MerR family transcriptional regulator [Flavobacteriales bacterium]|nr:MerR family transcriptional regulator [Flavobacteriales bacterium]
MQRTYFQYSEEQTELIKFIIEKRYPLETIGISGKTIFDWSKQGLLLEDEKPKTGRRKYNIIDFLWLKLVVKLREFGLSIDAIKRVKETLLFSFSLKDLYTNLINGSIPLEHLREEDSRRLQSIQEEVNRLINENPDKGLDELLIQLSQYESSNANSVIGQLILDCVVHRENFHILITSNGNTFVSSSESPNDVIYDPNFNNEPHINISIHYLLNQFIKNKEVISTEELVEQKILSEKEAKLLELVRTENISSLTVRFDQNNEIKLIEVEENIEVNQPHEKIADFLMRSNFQEIICKTQNGKVTSFKRKVKHKP